MAGIVRCECAAELASEAAVRLADATAAVLPRFASEAHKDARAPQNLYPIGGLERQLRHRLGDARLLYRALRTAAGDPRARRLDRPLSARRRPCGRRPSARRGGP